MLLPFIVLTMSPGRCAPPPGMFSVAATIPATLILGLVCPITFMAAMTAAPPDMSLFISPILSDGFKEIPPLSNVMPLPTMASPFAGSSGSPSYFKTISFGGSLLPWATPSNAPMPRSSI